jgi:hypothetical protein
MIGILDPYCVLSMMINDEFFFIQHDQCHLYIVISSIRSFITTHPARATKADSPAFVLSSSLCLFVFLLVLVLDITL